MKKVESTITTMILSLVGVALVTGCILAYVNHITAAPIKAQAEKTLQDGITAVMGGGELTVCSTDTIKQEIKGKEVPSVVYETKDKQGNALGAAIETSTNGFGGELKVLVGFSTEGDILGYTILQHSETPGLGAKAAEWFQKKDDNEGTPDKSCIIGLNPGKNNMTVSKDGGEVDAITASTITSRAFLLAVNQAYNAYWQKLKKASSPADAQSGATQQAKETKH